MGSSRSSKDEWIEIKNNTDHKIQLNGWQIDNLLRSNGTFFFPDEPIIEIEGKSYFLVSYYSKIDGSIEGTSVLDHKGLVWRCNGHPSCASFSLANSNNGDLVLRDNNGKEIDRVSGDSWPAGKKEDNVGYSMERINPLSDGSDPDNWGTATEAKNLISGVSDKATPESENGSFLSPTSAPPQTPTNTPTPIPTPTLTPAPASYPSGIYISEFMANPETGDDEWVEIHNANSKQVILTDWYIDDKKDGGAGPKKFSTTIPAGGYYVINFSSGTLNNDGDDVRLLNPDGEEVDKKSYSETAKGKSWSEDSNGNWCQVDPTKNQSNPSCPAQETPTPTPTPTLTPRPTPTPTKKLSPTPTFSGEVLGATEAGEATLSSHPEEEKDEEKELEEKGKGSPFLWPKVLIGLGLSLIIGASYPLWLPKLKMMYNIKEIIRGNAAKPRLTRRSE